MAVLSPLQTVDGLYAFENPRVVLSTYVSLLVEKKKVLLSPTGHVDIGFLLDDTSHGRTNILFSTLRTSDGQGGSSSRN